MGCFFALQSTGPAGVPLPFKEPAVAALTNITATSSLILFWTGHQNLWVNFQTAKVKSKAYVGDRKLMSKRSWVVASTSYRDVWADTEVSTTPSMESYNNKKIVRHTTAMGN